MFGFIVAVFAERSQEIRIILLEIAALHLNVHAVAYQRQFILSKYPLIREYIFYKGPSLIYYVKTVSGAFHCVHSRHMKYPGGLILFHLVEHPDTYGLFTGFLA